MMSDKLGEKRHTRDAYGKALAELGGENPDIVVLDADLSSSTKTRTFADKFPDRFFNIGCAEQNLMGVSAGLALSGKTVFASTFAMFGSGRCWEQIRNSIAFDKLNVKIVLTHAGLSVGGDGSSHQMLEDIALMRVIPNMRVIVPADYLETYAMVKKSVEWDGPAYIRLSRDKSPNVFTQYTMNGDAPTVMAEGSDVSIFSCGMMVSKALEAAKMLKKDGISAKVVNVHTIKPLCADSVVESVKETGAAVTCEEHSIVGGLGDAVSLAVCERVSAPILRIGVKDVYGRSGEPDELFREYGLTVEAIAAAAKRACDLK